MSLCLSVRLSVRSAQSCLEHSIFIFQPQILHDDFRMTQRALSMHSEGIQSTQRALREYLKSTQREREQSDFVIPSEPKILCLVL